MPLINLVTSNPRSQRAEVTFGVGSRSWTPDAFRLAVKADSWEDFSYYIRCITRGVTGSIFPVIYGNGQQIVQGPGYVTILQEMVHESRVIPLDGRPHLPQSVRQWNGDSRGRWDGKTLVVDTTNFSTKSNFMGSAENLHLVERFTRVAPDTINYEIMLDDSTMTAGGHTCV